ncbi:MAG TPA: TrbI/VirB10 family protein [Allosphingosinicella sp.]|jgi:type IV secretion system protein VirB10|nr:TrbI/VirB10 family protein [Allosphingosinicella sp.]
MAIRGPAGDPRVEAGASGEASVRPVVGLPRRGLPGWAIGVGALVAGVLLFTVLDARRRAPSAPAVKARAADLAGGPPPPPLYVPPALPLPVEVAEAAPPPPAPPPPQPRIVYVPQPYPVPTPAPVQEAPTPPARVTNDPTLVFDFAGAPTAAAAAAAVDGNGTPVDQPGAPATATLAARTRAGMLANRATTVAQGTLIPAVLETALDSTRPGFARAIVSRDVRGFDGSRVLIPRGSRLIGEYRSEAAPGQRRALVIWTRLIRPDGVTVAIASPAGDPLGRGGIRARVNSHFFERFAGAILQSGLDIGVNLASRAGSGNVIILPGTVQSTTSQIIQPAQITPTLTVRQGTSISIFVARDLDFTGVENRR